MERQTIAYRGSRVGRVLLACVLGTMFLVATASAQAPSNPDFPAYLPASWTVSGKPLKQPGEGIDRNTRGVNQWCRYARLWVPRIEPYWRNGFNGALTWPGGRTVGEQWWSDRNHEGWGSFTAAWGGAIGCRNWDATLPTKPTDLTPVNVVRPYNSAENVRYKYNLDSDVAPLCASNSGDVGDAIIGYSRLESNEIMRWLPPQVIVNGRIVNSWTDSYGTPGSGPAGDGLANYAAARRGIVDPTLRSEVVHQIAFRMSIGADVYQQIYANGFAPDYDYLVLDYHVINTGNLDTSAAKERPNKDIEDFRFAWGIQENLSNPAQAMSNANANRDDDYLQVIQPWPTYTAPGGEQRLAHVFYDGDGSRVAGPDWGDAAGYFSGGKQLTGNDLWAKAYLGFAYLFVESAPGSGVDDPAQPRSFTYYKENDYRFTASARVGTSQEKAFKMIWCGSENAATADAVKMLAPSSTPRSGINGGGTMNGLTPFQGIVGTGATGMTLPANATFHTTFGIAVGGIGDRESKDIATAVKRRDAAYPPINPADRMTAAEIARVQTGWDSMMVNLDRMFWNVNGFVPGNRFAAKPSARNQAFNVPDPPRPPACLWVTNGNGYVALQWTRESETAPDFDTGVNDFAGYRVYRAKASPDSDWVVIADLPKSGLPLPTVTTVTWQDATASTNFTYYYYVAAYDDGTQNWDQAGRKLESGKFYNWTGWLWMPNRDPGYYASPYDNPRTALDSVFVVPNPYNARIYTPIGAQGTVERIFFRNLPLEATVRIYTTAGSLVRTLYHKGEVGSATGASLGWDMSNDYNQLVATGVYIYTVECTGGPAQGATAVGKFIVIR